MKVNLAHGGGGVAMEELLHLLTAIKNNTAGGIGLEARDDGAVIPLAGHNLVFTTDAYIVRPPFFPGGDIGRLCISGTCNDLAMMGGKPIALSSAVILEEGYDTEDLKKIVRSMDFTLDEVGANLVTGDTKVMERGSLDGIVITTSGIGIAQTIVRDNGLVPGDKIIVSGTLGDHGIALLVYREGFDLGEQILSDVAPIWGMIEGALAAGPIHAMKDPTRGGFAGAITQMAEKSEVSITIHDEDLPFRRSVRSAAALLGIDPLEVANEGKAILGVPEDSAEEILAALRRHRYGSDAAIVGTVREGRKVILESARAGERFIEPPLGDPIPRVC